MAKHDESELRIVEVKGSLPIRQLPGPVRAMPQPRRAPTRAEALEAVQSMKGAASVIERISMLGDITSWNEFAHWGLREQTGAAVGGSLFVWNCDFFPGFEMGDAYNYASGLIPSLGAVYFLGANPGEGVEPPAGTGEVWCYMDVPLNNSYLFVAQVLTSLDEHDKASFECCSFECWIDTSSLGTVTAVAGGPINFPFLAQLSSGPHRFVLQQVTGPLLFVSLTAWQIPYPTPRPVGFTGSQ
jgi:hypothetical protein